MEPEVWKAIGATVGLVLGVPTVALIIRVTLFFGKIGSAIDTLNSAVTALSGTVKDLNETLTVHAERIAGAEASIDGLERRERDRLRVGAYDRRGS